MKNTCPHCNSNRIVPRNHGRKACSTLGTFAGAHLAVRSIRMGTMVGRFFGPPGILLGGTAGLVIAGISGAMIGGSTGARLGTMLDNNILNNYRCLNCKKSFSEPNADTLDLDYPAYRHDEEEENDSDLLGSPNLPAIY